MLLFFRSWGSVTKEQQSKPTRSNPGDWSVPLLFLSVCVCVGDVTGGGDLKRLIG